MPKLSKKITKSMKSLRGGVKKTKSRKTSRKSLRRGVKLTKSKKPLRGCIKRKKSRRVLLGGQKDGQGDGQVVYAAVVANGTPYSVQLEDVHPKSANEQLLKKGYWLVRESSVPGKYKFLVKLIEGGFNEFRIENLIQAGEWAKKFGVTHNMVKPKLWQFAESGDLFKVKQLVEQLLDVKQKAKLDEVNKENGCTALHYASINGYSDIVRELLNSGAKTNVVTLESESTPLHFAAANGKTGIVRDLIDFKADVNAKDASGNTPLANAENKKNKLVVTIKELEAEMLRTAGGGM